MTRQPTVRCWTLASGLLLCGLALAMAAPAFAWRGRPHHGFAIGAHHRYHYHYPYRYYGPRSFLGFHFYGAPYFYRPYYYESYSPGEHRYFPAFRLPGFFHYPGAIGKGEAGLPTGGTQEEPPRQGTAMPFALQRRVLP